jgi:glucokinase
MAAAMGDAARAAGTATSQLDYVGVGSPGEIDARAGTVANARNLPGWIEPFSLAAELERKLGTAISLGNDVQVATDAEAQLGVGRPYRSMLGVFWGTGVGGGIILDDRPWLGRGAAGEIGHVVVKRNGARCPCGRRGCMEAYAGRAALERRARRRQAKGAETELFEIMAKSDRQRMTSGVWATALKRHDPLAVQLMAKAVAALGVGVASVVNVLDVEAVILGGGLGVRLGQPYADKIAAAMLPHLFNDHQPPPVLPAALGDLGGAIGASLLKPTAAAGRYAS